MKAVSFDFGQTLAELDHSFLARRVAERGATLDPARARAATAGAWRVYGEKKPLGHERAWLAMMETMLALADTRVTGDTLEQIAAWLWTEQPRANLWRRPLPGMFELCAELKRAGIPIAVLSNSEGFLADLVDELGHRELFVEVVDSGRLPFDKPDPRIFHHTCQVLGVSPAELVHVGDSWEADVLGARAVGARAVWFVPTPEDRPLPEGVSAARDAAELRSVFAELGVLG